jgi:predicted phage terminase large subunit-like protein
VALPMIAEPDDPLGREIGEVLWPEQFPKAWVERERLGMPPAEWAAVFQCSAAQMAGDVFSDERWIKPLPRDFFTTGKDGTSLRESLLIVQGVDVAFSEKDSACFTVILTLGIDRNKQGYILDVHRARMTVKQTEDAIVDRIQAYEPAAVGLEDTAFKHAVTAQLIGNIRRRVMVNIKAVAPRGMVKGPSDKVARARLPASRAEAGLLYADRSAAWWPSFIGELLAFPRGKTADQVDALSLATYLGVTFQQSRPAPKRLVFTPH